MASSITMVDLHRTRGHGGATAPRVARRARRREGDITRAQQATIRGMPHEPRLTHALRALLHAQRVATLGTLSEDGSPLVSMVPFALRTDEIGVVIHVSGLAAHTANLRQRPAVSLLVMQPEVAGEPVHALPRASFLGQAVALSSGSTAWQAARAAYLARFPEAEPMTALGDFQFFAITMRAARQVAGFGAARTLDDEDLAAVLRA